MPDVVDEKVVSMRFDNKQFEKGVAESLKSIQELKDSLDFDKSVKSLDNLSQAGKKFSFSGVSEAVDTVKQKFSALEVAGITALANITNQAVNAGKRMASAITIDPIREGINVYEQKLNSVQTIMNNSGKSLEETNKILDELNNYSDKTIFSLADMTTALGKFTAAGIDAADAVTIIKGAANEAATMGAGSAEFSRFIYNLSQAYSVGKMTMIDWKSLENAGIAGVKFKQTLVDAARELGTINEEFEKKHGVVTATNLREFLKEGIITNEVMTKAFNLYADTNTEFGKAAEAAATQIKTFHQLLDVLKESVASKWSQAWTYIIGDFNEAKKLWTGVSAIFEATLGKINENRNQLLKLWHDGFVDPETNQQISGRRLLLDGLANILQTIAQIIKPIKDAFREVFPAKTAENLWEATKAFRDFTAQLRLSEGTMKNIKDFAQGVFDVLRTVRTVFKDLLAALFPATAGVDSLLQIILALAGAFGRFLTRVTTAIRESEEYQAVLRGISQIAVALIKIVAVLAKTLFNVGKAAKESGILQKAIAGIATVVGKVIGVVMKYGPKVVSILGAISRIIFSLAGLLVGGVASIGNFFKNLFSKKDGESAAKGIHSVAEAYEKLGPEMTRHLQQYGVNLTQGFSVGLLKGAHGILRVLHQVFGIGVAEKVAEIFGIASPSKVFMAIGAFCLTGLLIGLSSPTIRAKITESLATFAESGIVQGFKDVLTKAFNGLASLWSGAVSGIVGLVQSISLSFQGLGEDTETLGGKIGTVFNNLVSGIKNINGAAILLTAIIGTALVGVIKLISVIVNVTGFLNEAGHGFRNITKSFVNTTKAFKQMAKAFKRQQNPIVQTLKGIAFSILAVTTALLVLTTIEDKNSLWTAAAVLAASLLAIVATLTAAAKRIKAGDLEGSMNAIAKTLIIAAASLLVISIAFSSMVSILSDTNNSVGAIIGAFVGIVALTGVMLGMVFALSKIDFKSGMKAALLMLAFSILMNSAVKSLKKLANMSNYENIYGAMLGLAVVLGAIAGIAFIATRINMSGVWGVLAVTILMRTVVYVINSVNWKEVLTGVQDYAAVILGIITILALMAVGAAYIGKGVKNFGQGVMDLGISLLAMAAAIAVLKAVNADVRDITKLIGVITEVVGLLALVLLVCKYSKIPQDSMKELSRLMASIGVVMLEMAVAVGIASKLDADGDAIKGMGWAMLAFIGGITLILTQLDHARGDNDLKDLSKLIKAFIFPMLGLAVLAKVYQGSTAGEIFAVIMSLVGIFVGIGALCMMVGNIKEEQVKFLSKLTALLLVAVGDLIVLSMIPIARLAMSMGALAAVMISIAVLTKVMGNVKTDAVKPMLVVVAILVVIGASLTVLAKMCDWQNVLAAAGAMSATIIAVAASLAIVSGFKDKAIQGAIGLLIASASLIVVAASLNMLANTVVWDSVWQACVSILAVAGALAAVSAFGEKAIIGAFSLGIASSSLLIIAAAMQQFMAIEWGAGVGKMAAILGILTAFIAVFGLFDVIAIPGAIGLIMASIGLIAVAKAMQMFSEATVGGGYLAGVAGSLMLMAIAGVLLTAGAPGLISGGLGIIILAAGLRVLSGVNTEVVNGKTLSGIAGGLMVMGLAGVVLGLGAAGLISGGVGMIVLAGALALMDDLDYKALSKKNLTNLGKGLLQIALAGMAGTLAGPGLLALAAGLTAVVGTLKLFTGTIEALIFTMKTFGENDAVGIGSNVILGMVQGIKNTTGVLMSSIGSVFTGFIGGICGILGIQSPSEVMRRIGQFTGLGFLEGWADSDIMKKLDEVSASIANNHILEPFTSTLADGFGGIGNLFSGIFKDTNAEIQAQIDEEEKLKNQLTTKMRIARANGNTGLVASLSRDIGRVEERIAKLKMQLTEDNLLGGLSIWESIFDGLQNGLEGLSEEWFPELKDIMNQTDIQMEGMNVDANALAGGLDQVSEASKATTKSFAENMDIFSEFDRSLKTTVQDIETNMINQLLGTDQWTKYLNNLEAYGYDPKLIAEIADKGIQGGYQLAAALNAAGSNAQKVAEINEFYSKAKGDYAGAAQKQEEHAKAWAESGKEAVRDLEKVKVTQDMVNGEMAKIANGAEDRNVLEQIIGKGYESEYVAGMNLDDFLARLSDSNEASKALAEEREAALEAANQSSADAMITEMADAIKNSINKYLPASAFVQIGENICMGLTAGVIVGKSMTVAEIERLCNTLKLAAMGALDEHSPSKVFEQIGKFCTEGLALGLQDSTEAEKSTELLGKGIIDLFEEQLAKIQDLINSDEEWSPTIKPVVDLSNVSAGAASARMAFDNMQIAAAARDFSNFKLNTAAPENTIAGMSKNEFAQFLSGFADAVVDGIANADIKVTSNVNLKGEAKRIFTVVREDNEEYKRATGYSAFV